MQLIEEKAKEYVVAFYDGERHVCFDEDRYSYEDLEKALKYCIDYNKDYRVGGDYVKLYAYIESTGLVLLLGEPEEEDEKLDISNLCLWKAFDDKDNSLLIDSIQSKKLSITIENKDGKKVKFELDRENGLELINILTQKFK